jgi:hypothetical protein
MKKWLVSLLVVCLLFLGSIYLFIPGKILIAYTVFTPCTESGAVRSLGDSSKWKLWWPSSGQKDSDGHFTFRDIGYHLERKTENSFLILIESGNLRIPSRLNVLHIGHDSVAMEWSTSVPTSLNPVNRIAKYNEAKIIHQNMNDLLQNLKLFFSKKENIYGYNINMVSTKDTLLISTKSVMDRKPMQADIYSMISFLKKYTIAHGASQNGYPMTNISKINSDMFQLMVAIPINKVIPEGVNVEFKRMVPGKFLMAETAGGEKTVNNALEQISLYMRDYRFNDVALPFQVLVTDRSVEMDTTKWVTRIYYPIYYL